MERFERSTFQLMSVLNCNKKKDAIHKFAHNPKTHSTFEEKKFILLYAEDLHFLIKRAALLMMYI